MSKKLLKPKENFDCLVEHNNSGRLSSFIMNSSDLAIKVKTLEGVVTFWNYGAEKMYGYKSDEIIGKNISLIVPQKHLKELELLTKKTVKGETIPNYETERLRKDGTLIHVSLSFFPIKDEKGKIIGVASIDKDITEARIAGKELIFQTKEKANRAAELAIADKELIYQIKEKANRAAELAIADKELIFQTKEKANRAAELAIADKELIYQTKEKANRAAELAIADKELIYQTKEKANRAAELVIADKELIYQTKEKANRAAELVIAGKELIYQNLEKEKLETLTNTLKHSSQYARSLIEASKDPLVTISEEGKITDVNEASINVTGLSREKLIGTDFSDYFTEPKKARKGYKMVFDKLTVTDFPLTIRHINGKLTDVLYNASVYKDEEGKVLGICATARDVTFQKSISKELNEAKSFAEKATFVAEEAKRKAESATILAQDAVKAKQQFLSNMSHEIRTPMNAIIGFTKVVLKTDLTAKQREYLTAIKLSGDALIVLINDILDLAKVDAGKMTFEKIPFKLNASITAMLHLFDSKVKEKNLKLISEYDSNIPEVIIGDPVRLHQIILNLVSNAVKFTNHGSITVAVKLVKEDVKNVTIQFEVSDTGIGIATNKLDKIFENFHQASSGTSRLYGGTGLGLAIVKQLVEPQGGKIVVTSKIDVGSIFSFSLVFPKTIINDFVDLELIKLDNEIKNISVLVVEDIALNQLLMKTLLEDFGFGCDIAANGKIAIEKLETKKYDIILMDLQMPEMNGFEATNYIRNALNLTIPIVALTADVTTVDLAKCKAVGMDDYIAKPVDEQLLYSKIIGLIRKLNTTKQIIESTLIKKYKHINLAYLYRCTKSDPSLMLELITLYLEQTEMLIGEMKNSYEVKDWSLLQLTVHKMIPSFTIMGINQDFENMAKSVQEFAKAQEEFEDIAGLILQLEEVCKLACIELQEEYNFIKKTINEN